MPVYREYCEWVHPLYETHVRPTLVTFYNTSKSGMERAERCGTLHGLAIAMPIFTALKLAVSVGLSHSAMTRLGKSRPHQGLLAETVMLLVCMDCTLHALTWVKDKPCACMQEDS